MSTETEYQQVAMPSSEHMAVSPTITRNSTSNPAMSNTITSPINQSGVSSNSAQRAFGPPPGYKLIKRRKEDGTFITVARKMTPEELEMAAQKAPASETGCGTASMSSTGKEGTAYKIITVRDSDGAVIRVKRPVKAERPACTTSSPAEKANGVALESADRHENTAQSTAVHDSEFKSPTMSAFADVIASGAAKATDTVSPVVKERPIDSEAAILQQKETYRRKRMQKFRGSMIRGFGTVLGSSIGHLDLTADDEFYHSHEPAGDIQDGDIIDSDQSWSDDDEDDGEFGVGHEHEHGNDDNGESGHRKLNPDLKATVTPT